MKIKKQYNKPEIEEQIIDQVFSICLFSGVGPPPSSMEAPSPSAESPQYENPSASEYPFGGDSPDYTNM